MGTYFLASCSLIQSSLKSMEDFHRLPLQSDFQMYSGPSKTKGQTGTVPGNKDAPVCFTSQPRNNCTHRGSFSQTRKDLLCISYGPGCEDNWSANHATRCAVIKRYSPALFAGCLFVHAQAGWILISCGLTTNTEHSVCASLRQQWLAGHLEEICVHVSCYFHCQSFSNPAFCFSLFLTAEACYPVSCSLVAAPVGCFVCRVVTGRFSLDLVHTSARTRLFNTQAFISVLCRVHSTRATLWAFASKTPAHWVKSATTQESLHKLSLDFFSFFFFAGQLAVESFVLCNSKSLNCF